MNQPMSSKFRLTAVIRSADNEKITQFNDDGCNDGNGLNSIFNRLS